MSGDRIDVDALKRAVPIDVLVQSMGVELKQRGDEFTGLCPFHDDHRPSMSVTPGKGFYCHACGAGGDQIAFIQESRGVDFVEAAKILAEFAGGGYIDEVQRTQSRPTKKPKPADQWLLSKLQETIEAAPAVPRRRAAARDPAHQTR